MSAHPPRPRKALGQHWLKDSAVLRRIARRATASLGSGDTLIEAGAGTGLLTTRLAQGVQKLIAVEIDDRLAEALAHRFANSPSVVVVHEDILALTAEEILARGGGRMPYAVVGNLPYFAGTAIVRHFLYAKVPPSWMLVTLQAEVAERMAATIGSMSYLSVETQFVATAKVLFQVPPRAFQPPPKVNSAVLRLDLRQPREVEVDDHEAFLEVVRAGFAAPRKQLRNSLAVGLRISTGEAAPIISGAGLDARLRPGALSLMNWRDLYFAQRACRKTA